MKKKIVYVLHGLAAGGTEAFVLNVVSHLDRKKYDITFILALDDNGKTHQFHEDKVLEQGIKIYRTCDLDGIKKWKLHYEKLKKLLIEKGPFDVIHCNMDLFNGINLMAAKKAGVPVRICHSHIADSQYADSNLKKLISTVYRKLMRRLIFRYSTKIIGCSEMANRYLYGEKANKAEVVYNGINTEKFIQHRNKNRIKNRIVTVGRMEYPKNPLFVIEVISELYNLRNDFEFVWVGDGSMKEKIKDKADRLHIINKIKFWGIRNDIEDILGKSEYFLLPSIFEGFGIAVIEAQCAGLECFVSDNIPREINVGLCHYLSLDKSSKEWANYISNRLDMNRKKLSLNEKKLKQFDIKNTVKRLEEIYG